MHNRGCIRRLYKEDDLASGFTVVSPEVAALNGGALAPGHGSAHAGGTVVVSELSSEDFAAWDEFVFKHKHASPFHLIAWKKVIEETYGYRPVYLIAKQGSRITGVLPLFVVRNMMAGTYLLSTPFAVYGGMLFEDDDARNTLREHVIGLASTMKAQYVELRNAYEEQCAGFTRVSRYVTFSQELDATEDAIIARIPRKTRYMVRKSLKESFSTIRLTDRSQGFEDIYARNLRKLGTPCFPSRHFVKLFQHFGGMLDVREVRDGDKTAAAVLSFYFRDQVMPYYGASDPEFTHRAPNNFMYFDLMRWGGANGYRIFDFGRSKKSGSGSYDFKAHWGMMERELPYEILLVRRKELPNYSPNNPKFDVAIKMWRQLPLSVTRAIGPMFLRLVP